MRSASFRIMAVAWAIALIAAGCSKPADKAGSKRIGREDADSRIVDPSGSPAGDVEEVDPKNPAARARVGDKEVSAGLGNPDADRAAQLAIGRQIRPQSIDFPNGNRRTWTGVTDKEIKLAAGYDHGCGADIIGVLTAAGGALPTPNRYYRSSPQNQEELRREVEETIRALVDHHNIRAWANGDQYPHIKPLMEKFGNPEYPFFGRKLVVETFDSGSFQCPERTSAAATEVTEEIKAFATFIDRYDGTPTNMAAALHAEPANVRPMMFGTLWLPDGYYSKWAPYVWTQFASGTTITNQLASYICARVIGRKAVNSQRGETTTGTPFRDTVRKFGLLYPNRQEDRDRAAEFKGFVRQHCGRDDVIAVEQQYTYQLSRAADEGQQIMLQFRQANVTSVVMLTDPIFPLIQMGQASSVDYFPEWIFSSIGYADSNTVQRLYPKDQVNKASFGISQLGVPGGFAFGKPIPDPFLAYHTTHKVSPNSGKPCDPMSDAGMNHDPEYCKAPTAIQTYYYTVIPLIGGLLFAGPNLTPENVSKGLQAYPPTRYGLTGPTTDPRPALVGAGPGKYSLLTDAYEWRNRANFKSPYPDHKDRWVDFPDCQRHYTLWPDKLALYWEKGGPHYNSWCGDPKYAPADSPEKDNYPRITEGTKPN